MSRTSAVSSQGLAPASLCRITRCDFTNKRCELAVLHMHAVGAFALHCPVGKAIWNGARRVVSLEVGANP